MSEVTEIKPKEQTPQQKLQADYNQAAYNWGVAKGEYIQWELHGKTLTNKIKNAEERLISCINKFRNMPAVDQPAPANTLEHEANLEASQ